MSRHRLPEKPLTVDTPGRTRPRPAGPDEGRGTKGDGRQAVLSALPADQPPSAPPHGDGRFPVAWLHISAPRDAIPTATSRCLCGHDRSAVGRTKVLALIDDHATHRSLCPLRTTPEGRNAA
ncbi:hypothetical protein [Streptomyces aureoverticillatus]|uniref:hypothetical protein n=1 Tax=Streptomyces aureoverticillatus TaxID=66871 RepID=UPI001EF9033B|nr:hypothetical protein [Streptomyces aureoverticillatus]